MYSMVLSVIQELFLLFKFCCLCFSFFLVCNVSQSVILFVLLFSLPRTLQQCVESILYSPFKAFASKHNLSYFVSLTDSLAWFVVAQTCGLRQPSLRNTIENFSFWSVDSKNEEDRRIKEENEANGLWSFAFKDGFCWHDKQQRFCSPRQPLSLLHWWPPSAGRWVEKVKGEVLGNFYPFNIRF